MIRLSRKNSDYAFYSIPPKGGFLDLLNPLFCGTFRISDAELGFISENATKKELQLIISALDEKLSFSNRRKLSKLLDRLIIDFQNTGRCQEGS